MDEYKKKLKLESILDQVYRDGHCDLLGSPKTIKFQEFLFCTLNNAHIYGNNNLSIEFLLMNDIMRITVDEKYIIEVEYNKINDFSIYLGDKKW